MSLSKNWDTNENAYSNSRWDAINSTFNEGCMCIFENSCDGKVNRDVAIFAKENGRCKGLLYNNRLYIGVANKQEKHKIQYEANRQWIIRNIK